MLFNEQKKSINCSEIGYFILEETNKRNHRSQKGNCKFRGNQRKTTDSNNRDVEVDGKGHVWE